MIRAHPRRSWAREHILLATLISVSLLVGSTTPVFAYAKGTAKWCSYPEGDRANSIPYQLKNNWPGGNSGDQALAVSLGRDQWNRQNRELNYRWTGAVASWIDVTYEDLLWPNDGYLAVAFYDSYLQTGPDDWCLYRANIVFNSDPTWWNGSPGALWFWADAATDHPPAGKYDARSLASHEFGHLVMLNHVDSAYPVMNCCFGTGSSGERWVLTQDDKNGLNYWYPPK